eukprot:s2155_g2.t1
MESILVAESPEASRAWRFGFILDPLRLGEINVGSAVQACLAVRTSKSPLSSRWQQALMLFRTASTKRVLPDPACCGLLISECEQRGLQTVEEDIMKRLRDPSALEDDVLVTATAVANDIAARARTASDSRLRQGRP